MAELNPWQKGLAAMRDFEIGKECWFVLINARSKRPVGLFSDAVTAIKAMMFTAGFAGEVGRFEIKRACVDTLRRKRP